MAAPSYQIPEANKIDLDTLRQMNFSELQELYLNARRPSALSDLNGDAKGAMLAWRSPRSGPVANLLAALGKMQSFPWKGKSFEARGDKGEGINRISLSKKMRWFPFGTRFDASFLDGKPTFVLDYARPGNPPFIRQIVDEVREVAPGLYMGPAALKVGGKPRPILFFALSFHESSAD